MNLCIRKGSFLRVSVIVHLLFPGDKMGCGIIFPRDYVSFSDGDVIHELSSPNFDEDFSGSVSESDEEEWFQEKENTETGAIVQVFRLN